MLINWVEGFVWSTADVSFQHICLFIVKHLVHTAARCIEHYVHNTLLSNKPGLVAFSNAIMFLSHQNFMSAVRGSWSMVRWCESTNWRTAPQVALKLTRSMTSRSEVKFSENLTNAITWKRGDMRFWEHRGVRPQADSTFNKPWKKELSVPH